MTCSAVQKKKKVPYKRDMVSFTEHCKGVNNAGMNWEQYQILVQEPIGMVALASAGQKVNENISLKVM